MRILPQPRRDPAGASRFGGVDLPGQRLSTPTLPRATLRITISTSKTGGSAGFSANKPASLPGSICCGRASPTQGASSTPATRRWLPSRKPLDSGPPSTSPPRSKKPTESHPTTGAKSTTPPRVWEEILPLENSALILRARRLRDVTRGIRRSSGNWVCRRWGG